MEKNQHIQIESKNLYKTLATVALPIALQSLISSSLNLIDAVMVGRLGEVELAAVGLSNQLFFVHWGVMFGFASGSSAFMAQFWGKRDLESIRKVTGFAVTLCLGVSMFFFIPGIFFPKHILNLFTDIPDAINIGKDYIRFASVCFLTISVTVPFTAALRVTHQTKLPLKISAIALTTNTFLNYLLIFGNWGAPELGVKGAAIATAIARILELSMILYVVFIRKNIVAGKPHEFIGWHKALATKVLITAIPVMINETMWSLGMATYNAAYGRMGVTEFAAIQASNTINTMFIYAIFSLGDALIILVGQRLGRGEMDYAYALAKKLLKIGVYIGIISGSLLIVSSHWILQLFNFTPLGLHYAALIVAIYGIFMPLKVYNGLNIVGTFRSGGDTHFAMCIEVGAVWLIGVPMVFLGALVLHLPIYLVVLMAQSEEAVKSVICTKRFLSKKWVKNLVHDM